MSAPRGEFSSKLGFLMAAAGSAVGLGNIWGFPTQTASNGGAAFVAVYIILTFCLAYPALMAELVIGRHARANVVTALQATTTKPLNHRLGAGVGYASIVVAGLILSFYTIVASWMIAYLLEPLAIMFGADSTAHWLTARTPGGNLLLSGLFSALTMLIISSGIEGGIEKWSSRLMPVLLVLLLLLIIYVLTLPGAMKGLKVYLLPDFSHLANPKLFINALGQAFFSLSLGVGTMLIYGSYISRNENLPKLGAMVALIDTGIAFSAGLLVIPAIYVAQQLGTNIFTQSGELIAGPGLVFQVLPALFGTMGSAGMIVAFAFFALMTMAAITSSISMLEVPVSFTTERYNLCRRRATLTVGLTIFAISALIIFNFESLFGFVVDLSTKYSEPLLGVLFCIFAGWIWHRNSLLKEITQGYPEIADSLFWKIWPRYVRYVCPALILITFAQGLIES